MKEIVCQMKNSYVILFAMKIVTHRQQQEVWDQEHANPQVLLQMDSSDPSSGVVKFWQWFQDTAKTKGHLKGLEMGCGKGRSVIWLAQQGVEMTGFDFSPTAIKIAKERAEKGGVSEKTTFVVQDATVSWDFPSDTFDFAIDCFASTDIESKEGRQFATSEMIRVTKSRGYILVYVMSTDEEFHKEMIEKSPATEAHAFVHPTGKFEKVFTKEEIFDLYKGLKLISEQRVPKTAIFGGKEYACNHHWMVFQK